MASCDFKRDRGGRNPAQERSTQHMEGSSILASSRDAEDPPYGIHYLINWIPTTALRQKLRIGPTSPVDYNYYDQAFGMGLDQN